MGGWVDDSRTAQLAQHSHAEMTEQHRLWPSRKLCTDWRPTLLLLTFTRIPMT